MMTGMDASGEVRRGIAALADLDRPALLARWRAEFGDAVPRHLSRQLMIRALSWRMQARAHGGLAPQTARALRTLARSGTAARRLPAGARLVREWNGRTHVVEALQDGYAWNGRRFASLSAIAREITGARWSGPRFFGLTAQDDAS